MLVRFAALIFGSLVLLSGCSSGRAYPTNRDDDGYDLKAMALTEADIPAGMAAIGGVKLDNQQWAQTFNPIDKADFDARVNQLDAQGRVWGFVTQYAWFEPNAKNLRDTILPHLGRPHLFTVQSTLFTEQQLAVASTKGLCGIQAEEKDPSEEFKVPRIGDQSAGFVMMGKLGDFGILVETTVCFRTGRIVHAVTQQGLDGTQDIELSVRLAERMLRRVNDAFDGKAAKETPAAEKKAG